MNRATSASLIDLFVETGLIQFGDFEAADGRRPFLTRFELLASYPDVLRACVQAAAPIIEPVKPSRLLCAHDALPLGVALALHTGIPLIYSRGGDAAPADDLIGAYDIGHQTALIVNMADEHTALLPWVQGARRVGLETMVMLAVMEARPGSPHAEPAMPMQALTKLTDTSLVLAATRRLPMGQAQAVLRWINPLTP